MPRRDAVQEAQGQETILPELRPRSVARMVNVSELVVEGGVIRSPDDLVASVRSVGVIQALAVVQVEPGVSRYRVVAGRRRFRAAQLAGIEQVPCVIFEPGTRPSVARALTLIENNVRSPNPLTDYLAIRELRRGGFSTDDIADQLNLSRSMVVRRERLGRLIGNTFTLFEQGRMAPSVAELASSLADHEQDALYTWAMDQGAETTITAADVRRVRDQCRGVVADPAQVQALDRVTFEVPAGRGSTIRRMLTEVVREASNWGNADELLTRWDIGWLVRGAERNTSRVVALPEGLDALQAADLLRRLAARMESADVDDANDAPVVPLEAPVAVAAGGEVGDGWDAVLDHLSAAQAALPVEGVDDRARSTMYAELNALLTRVEGMVG